MSELHEQQLSCLANKVTELEKLVETLSADLKKANKDKIEVEWNSIKIDQNFVKFKLVKEWKLSEHDQRPYGHAQQQVGQLRAQV